MPSHQRERMPSHLLGLDRPLALARRATSWTCQARRPCVSGRSLGWARGTGLATGTAADLADRIRDDLMQACKRVLSRGGTAHEL